MSLSTLVQAITDLKQFVTVADRDTVLLQAILGNSQQNATEQTGASQSNQISQLVLDLVDGGRKLADILPALEESTADSSFDLSKVIRVYYEADSDGSVNEMLEDEAVNVAEDLKNPDKVDTAVGIIQVLPIGVMPAVRHVDAVTLLLTAIPTIEFSRAVPFVDVKVISPSSVPAESDTVRLNVPSLGRFLLGDQALSGQIKSVLTAGAITTGDQQRLVSGMEIFTSPQTLVDADPSTASGGGYRPAPVLDTFRPLLSLNRLTIDVVSAQAGSQAWKTAKLDLTLHDRSRLWEMAELIRPDLYQTTEILLEYGWSHPDGASSSSNSYGQLIDSSRVKEKFGISRSGFEFQPDGQVKITLELFVKGVDALDTLRIGNSRDSAEAFQTINELMESIARLKNNSTVGGLKEIRAQQIVASVSDMSIATQLSADMKRSIQEFLKRSSNTQDTGLSTLREILVSLYGSSGDGTSGAVNELETKISDVMKRRLSALGNGVDYPLDALVSVSSSTFTAKGQQLLTTVVDKSEYVSLAKVMLNLVAAPLSSNGHFDEVQLVFYAFNANAGLMMNANVGSMPIKVSQFNDLWSGFVKERGMENITIGEFVSWLQNNFLDDPAADAWGLSSFRSKYKVSSSTGQRVLTVADDTELTQLNNDVSSLMTQIGVRNGEFKQPQLDMYLESVPLGSSEEGSIGDDSKTLLRIHIFDKVATPYPGVQYLLDAVRDVSLGVLKEGDGATEDASFHDQDIKNVVTAAAAAGILTVTDNSSTGGGKVYKLSENVSRVKEFVANNTSQEGQAGRVPTLRYGTSASAILRASVKSISNPLLATDGMQRAGLGDPITAPPGTDPGIVPMLMLPTEMEMETLGCPLLQYAQQFFMDFDTGTTVDNLYAIVGLTHEIEQGGFKTRARLINQDAYGVFRSAVDQVKAALDYIDDFQNSSS